MTTLQRVAQVFGWLFVVIAIWGALLTGVSMDADLSTAPRLWGLFPINFLHNLVHLGLGLWGIAAFHALLGATLLIAALTLASRGAAATVEPAERRTVTPEDTDVDRSS